MTTQADMTDETVAAAVTGSRPDLERLAVIMSDRLRLMVRARLDSTAAQQGVVEEIAQEAMESLLRELPNLKNRTVAGLRAFASTIASRRVADYLRNPAGVGRHRARPASLDSAVGSESLAGPLWQFLSASTTSPSGVFHREELLARTMAELSRLREEYRAVITLAFFDQLTTAQIAERMGTSRQAAAMTLLRAVRSLRERLTGLEESHGGLPHGA